MSLNFPDSPSLDDTYAFNNRTWTWDGQAWVLLSSSKETIFTTSGTISDSNPVIINNDGTISTVGISSISTSAGTPVIFESTQISSYASFVYTGSVASAYDSVNQKVIVAYTDQLNSDKGRVVVGTVSGTSISFGTPVDFDTSAVSNISITYDENAQKVVIAYVNSTSNLRVLVGTVSGTTISLGTAYTGITENIGETALSYDSVSQKCVLAYTDTTNSLSKSSVGTVSGTTISFGTSATFESGIADRLNLVYDTSADKSVIVYRFSFSSRAVVGTVSGTSISFGTPLVADSEYTNFVNASYNKNSNKVVIISARFTTSDELVAIVGTVSGTTMTFETAVQIDANFYSHISSVYDEYAKKTVIVRSPGTTGTGTVVDGSITGSVISFGSPVTFESSGLTSISVTYDSTNQKVIVSYGDNGNSNYGTSSVITTAASITNLSSSNFLGFSNGSYNNSESALIDCIGKLNDGQTGLTVGEKYYVQIDGTLATTPDIPSVYAGIAVAADKILVKG